MYSVIPVVFSLFLVHSAYGVDLRPYNETAYSMFVANDFDADGVLTLTELDSSFDKYDVNGDGVESRHEYTEFVCTTSPALYQLSHYLFDEYDMDGDHHLRKEDYDNLHRTMDTNGDGSVTAEEFIAYWEIIFPKYENVDQHGQTFEHGQSACH